MESNNDCSIPTGPDELIEALEGLMFDAIFQTDATQSDLTPSEMKAGDVLARYRPDRWMYGRGGLQYIGPPTNRW